MLHRLPPDAFKMLLLKRFIDARGPFYLCAIRAFILLLPLFFLCQRWLCFLKVRKRLGSNSVFSPILSIEIQLDFCVYIAQKNEYKDVNTEDGAGSLFVLLALYCSINVCRLHVFSRLFSRGYFLSLNLSMIAIGTPTY
jgi:hypothetical protein